MKNEPLWAIEKRSERSGRYLNSPKTSEWRECGVIRARDRQVAAVKACYIVGSSAVRVRLVDEFYKPESLT
jgi:hypothetical protein